MNLIKHIANILALWTIPFVFVLFFMVITGFAFTYNEAITSTVFIIMSTLYFIMVIIVYASCDDELDKVKPFKTN